MSRNAKPTSMRAWVYRKAGAPSEVLREERDYKVPVITADDELIVKVYAAAVNGFDWVVMGAGPMRMAINKPACVGLDLAGIVVEVGAAVGSEYAPGTEVYGQVEMTKYFKEGFGSFAEYAIVRQDKVMPKPSTLTIEEAAGVSACAMTAWVNLNLKSPLKPAERVLILGGSGGVGTFAIQEAKATGCYVVVTCSAKNTELVKSLGADEVVDYTAVPAGDVGQYLSDTYGKLEETKFDHVVDAVGSMEVYNKCAGFLKHGVTYVCMGGGYTTWAATGWDMLSKLKATLWGVKGHPCVISAADSTKEQVEHVHSMIAAGKVKTVIASIHPWEEAVEAYNESMTHRAVGKIIVRAPFTDLINP